MLRCDYVEDGMLHDDRHYYDSMRSMSRKLAAFMHVAQHAQTEKGTAVICCARHSGW